MGFCALTMAILAAAVLLAPAVQGYVEYHYYPPWSKGISGETRDVFGLTSLTVYELWNKPSTGQGKYHAEVTTAGAGYGWDRAKINFSGNRFTASWTGTYSITYYWSFGGMAEVGVANFVWAYGGSQVSIWFRGNLKDLSTGRMISAYPWTTTVIDFSYICQICFWYQRWDWPTTSFYVSWSGTLYAGRTYELTTWLEGYIWAAAGGVSNNYAKEDFSVTNTQAAISTNAGGPPCIASGTPVLVSDGKTQSVDKLKRGDQVMSYDFATGGLVPSMVTSKTMRQVDQLEVINEGLLAVTPAGQPLYVRNGTWEGWVNNAYELQTGMDLFNPVDGTWTPVYSITTETGNFRVFDLSVEPAHDFVANGVLVHNKV